jgi:hypothetical protein
MTDSSPTPDVGPLSRVTALALTQRIRRAGEELWELLLEAYERQAHTALGYKTWQAYVATEFDISRGQSYRLINQAKVTLAIQEATGTRPTKTSRALYAIHVSAREADVLKDDLDRAATEVAELVASGSTPVQAVRQAVERRRNPLPAVVDDTDMTPEEFDRLAEQATPTEVLIARPIPVASRLVLTRADVQALVSHIEMTEARDAAQLLTDREVKMIGRWLTAVVSERRGTLAPVKPASKYVEPRFKTGNKK